MSAGMISAINTLRTVFDATGDLTTGQKRDINLIKTNGSITKLLSTFVIEPVIICSKNAKQTSVFDKLLQLNTDIFASFYSQAFKILTDIYGLEAKFTFDILSTDNSIILENMSTATLNKISKEEFGNGSMHELFSDNKFIKLSVEDDDKKDIDNKTKIHNSKDNNDEMLKGLLQKSFNVDIRIKTQGNEVKTVQIPITVKSHIIVTDTKNILNMLKPNSKDKTLWYRFNEYRAGAITFRELVMCDDIIEEYKQSRLKDKDGLMEMLESRKTNSMQRAFLGTNMVGYERNYNMLILTTDEKPLFDKHVNGDITNEKNKQKLLSEAYSLSLTLVDEDYERVNIYTRDIRGSSDIGFKVLNKRKNNDGSELGEILKSLLLSKPMSF